MKENKKYFLGLDIGTNSVGWSLVEWDVINQKYKIAKKNGKSLWGVRMFEEAKDASERRGFRTSRKNIARRKHRIELLRELMAEEINKVDPTFFQRLDDSFYFQEDKLNKNKYTLFNDGETDYNYFKKFPTTYHLRKYLIESNQKEDIRYIYLAISQMLKKRGNFLNDTDEFKTMDKDAFNQYMILFCEYINELFQNISFEDEKTSYSFNYKNDDFNKIKDAFDINFKRDRLKKLNEILNPDNDKNIKDYILPFLNGSDIKLNKINFLGIEDVITLNISMEGLDLAIDDAKTKAKDQDAFFEILTICKQIYDFFFLGKLLKDTNYLSEAMVKKYNQHEEDLIVLKTFVKSYNPSKYYECFRRLRLKEKDGKKEKVTIINNYAEYVGFNRSDNSILRTSKAKKEDFYAYLKKNILSNIIETDESKKMRDNILSKIEAGDFLNKLATSDNSVFPYQLNLTELKIILEKQSHYYDFLNKKEDDLTIKDKIISILKFRIPYYVGPLNKNSNHAWLTRGNEKIYPWNFEKVVDTDKTAVDFIQRMQNKCTYLRDCYCMPKSSILFSKYNVLSVLNKININGRPITVEDKIDLIEKIFEVKRKVTKKDIIDYFKATKGSDVIVTTSTNKPLEELNCNMGSYCDFVALFGKELVDNNLEIIEKLILDISIFEDKNILYKRILNESSYEIFRTQAKNIKGLNYKGYASISSKLIKDIYSFDDLGVTKGNILEIMLNTNYNLQEILNIDEFGFKKQILEYNKQNGIEYTNAESFINEELYLTPVMKRPLIQAYKIIEEVEKIIGTNIDEYYVECARTNQAEKKRSTTRKDNAKRILQAAIDLAKEHKDLLQEIEIKKLIKECDELDTNAFQSDKYYLYFMQLGKCMYSLEPINFHNLNNEADYDIDHIIPQALFKDDSFENKALVLQELNKRKSNSYPIPNGIQAPNAYKFYSMLRNKNLIGNRKYDSLIKKELSDADIDRFVNRQLVVTNQAVKGLITVLKEFKEIEDKNIIYSKAENVSDFRQMFDIVKSRTANNFHHAHDAYLNVIVGRAVNNYFKFKIGNDKKDIKFFNAKGLTTNAMRIFAKERNNELIINNYENYWNEDILKQIEKDIFTRFDIMTTTRTYSANELYSKVSIIGANKNTKEINNLFSIKPSNPILSQVDKYGGLNNNSFSHYCLIEVVDKKGIKHYIIEPIPRKYANNKLAYLKENYNKFNIIIDTLNINTIIEQEHLKYCPTGVTNDSYVIKNLNERHFNKEAIVIIKKIDKYIQNIRDKKTMNTDLNNNIIIAQARNHDNKQITISNLEIDFMLELLLEVYNRKEYLFDILKNISKEINRDLFTTLSIYEKIKVISELLTLLKCNERGSADLTLLNMAKSSGILKINKKLKPGMKIVYESITGYYKKVVWEYPNEF